MKRVCSSGSRSARTRARASAVEVFIHAAVPFSVAAFDWLKSIDSTGRWGCGRLCPPGVREAERGYGGGTTTLGDGRVRASTTVELSSYASSPGVIAGALDVSKEATLRKATLWVS